MLNVPGAMGDLQPAGTISEPYIYRRLALCPLWHWHLWPTWTSTVDAALKFVVSLTAVAFQVQKKLVAVIVIAAFVAELWRLLGLGLVPLDYDQGNAAVTLSFNSLPWCSDLWFYSFNGSP
jgi:hypothetical protein